MDLASLQPVATIAIGGKPAGVAITPDGRFAYVTSPDAKALTVVDAATRQVVGRIDVGGGPLGVAVAPDGAHRLCRRLVRRGGAGDRSESAARDRRYRGRRIAVGPCGDA